MISINLLERQKTRGNHFTSQLFLFPVTRGGKACYAGGLTLREALKTIYPAHYDRHRELLSAARL